MSRTRIVLIGAAVGAFALTGCSFGSEATVLERPAASGSADAEAVDRIVVEPLDSIDGAAPYESDGVLFSLPEGMTVDRRELSATLVQLVVQDPEQERAPTIITVSRDGAATDNAVVISSSVAAASLGANGATDIVESGAVWSVWPYALAVTANLESVQAQGGADSREILLLTVRNEAGTAVITVSADAPKGQLEASAAYEILRSARPGADDKRGA